MSASEEETSTDYRRPRYAQAHCSTSSEENATGIC